MIQPIYNNVLIRPLDAQETTNSGIIIPDTAQEKPQLGEVMEVGFGEVNKDGKTIPLIVKKGQKVLYKKWGGNDVKVDGQTWLMIEEKDILGIVLE